MALYNFKRIQPVPAASDFLDIVLSKTQRKTPTVIHKNYKIGRIRHFYMRKVKFTQDTFEEKFKAILEEFPKLDDIHPFYADLMNVLYDKDHYKLALGQLNTARHLIDQVAKEYVRLLKFGDSLYRCKQLKKAALGRMATIMRRQKDSLAYLEQVRQHLSRLPSIDPNTRTLLICGYPNVGKSSFMNKITRADVDVQPYAFTTKSLFVGHMDYKYLRWQVIDTPGILDHPLEQMNTIEMQSVTALAHLRACILFFMDLSEQCGYSVEDQPLFANKPTFIMINKIDVVGLVDLPIEQQTMLKEISEKEGVQIVQLSCFTDSGVMDARNLACDKLLAARVEVKLKGHKINDIINKIHLAEPQSRDNVPRPPIIPEKVIGRPLFNFNDPQRARLERDLETEGGGPGVFNVDLKKLYLFKDPDWKYDTIPEIVDGRNIADFIDPDIQEKLENLEREEEKLAAEGFYDSAEETYNSEEEELRNVANAIKEKKKLMVQVHRARKMMKNRPIMPRTAQTKTIEEMEKQLGELGLDTSAARSRSLTRKRKRNDIEDDSMDIDRSPSVTRRIPSVSRDRSRLGLSNEAQKQQTEKIKKFAQRRPNMFAKVGESDRSIQAKRPKHLFSKKTGSTKRESFCKPRSFQTSLIKRESDKGPRTPNIYNEKPPKSNTIVPMPLASAFRNMFDDSAIRSMITIKVIKQNGFVTSNGVHLRGPVILLNGEVFLWDVPQSNITDSISHFDAWEPKLLKIFDVVMPKPGNIPFLIHSENIDFWNGQIFFTNPIIPSRSYPQARDANRYNGYSEFKLFFCKSYHIFIMNNAVSTFRFLSEEGRRAAAALLPLKPT
ncbi:hypothetical protein G9A89_001523, partial [Geosiphon pyriformis]